jgi:integrase
MQLEPHDNKEGYRVWLEPSEQDQLARYYEGEEGVRELAIRLMLCGLRSEEVPGVTKESVRRLKSDEEAYKLGIYGKDTTGQLADGKWRETPIPGEVKTLIFNFASFDGRKDEPLVDVSPRTVQRWVTEAAESLAEETGDDDWLELSAHDLRRSWATMVYYRLDGSDVAKSVIMRWGGWSKQSTFEKNYLGREPDELAAELMETAGLR